MKIRSFAALAILLAATSGALLALRARTAAAPAEGGTAGDPGAEPPRSRLEGSAPTHPPILPAATAEEWAAASPGPALEGSVVDTLSGAGIPGAELTFSLAGSAGSVRAGGDGAFRFRPPAAGTWALAAATAPGHLPFAPEWGHSPITFDAREARVVRGVTIRLAPVEPIEGRVLGPDGRPFPGADVRLLGAHLEAALVPIADRFTTGADGRFTFSAPEGTVVEARAEGLLPGRAEVDVLALARGAVTIQLAEGTHSLPPDGPIAGRVVGSGGEAIEGALVTASRELGFGVADATAAAVQSGGDGTFTLPGPGPGYWRVTARLAGRIPGTARRVEPGARDVVLTLAGGGRLRGCARDGATGAPIATLTVHVFDVRSALRVVPRESRASIDPSGCLAIDDLTPGPARVIVSAPGYAPSPPRDVEVPVAGRGEAVVDARLDAGGRLTGVVVSEETGAPVEGARVALEGQLEPAAAALPALAQTATDARGRFELAGLPRRASIFVAAAGHHARIVGGIEASPGETAGPITVALRPAAPGEEPRVDLGGIGARLASHGDGEGLTISSVVPDGGAARAGLGPGDVILGVEGRRVVDLGTDGAIQEIRGPEGTVVTLTVRRGERVETVRVTRTVVRG